MINKLAAEAYENMTLSTGMTKQAFFFVIPLGSNIAKKESLAGLRGEEAQKFWEDENAKRNRMAAGFGIGAVGGGVGGYMAGRVGDLPAPDADALRRAESKAKFRHTHIKPAEFTRYGRDKWVLDADEYARDVNKARRKLVKDALKERKIVRGGLGGLLGIGAGLLGGHLYDKKMRGNE